VGAVQDQLAGRREEGERGEETAEKGFSRIVVMAVSTPRHPPRHDPPYAELSRLSFRGRMGGDTT
jgi:hypothetical protein